MPQAIDIEDVRKLSVEQRLKLIEAIWQTLADEEIPLTKARMADDPEPAPFSPEQWEEIQRRLKAYRDDPASAHSYEEYKAKIRSLL
jgi:putative addiction module component (TIGR02574 family)